MGIAAPDVLALGGLMLMFFIGRYFGGQKERKQWNDDLLGPVTPGLKYLVRLDLDDPEALEKSHLSRQPSRYFEAELVHEDGRALPARFLIGDQGAYRWRGTTIVVNGEAIPPLTKFDVVIGGDSVAQCKVLRRRF